MKAKQQLKELAHASGAAVLCMLLAGGAVTLPGGIGIARAADANATEQNTYVLDEITVSADKREQSVQEVPVSVSVIGATQVEDKGVTKTEDIFPLVPNIYLTKTGPAAAFTTFATVRGVTSSMGGSPALGYYVDDVYYPGLDMTLLDIERIEVLRGPQGTLYGRNTEAGVINIITKQPENDWKSRLTMDYGSFNTRGMRGTATGALVEDTVFLRATGNYEASDNYFTNKFDDDDSVNGYENFDGRFKVQALPSSDLDLSVTFDVQNYRSDGYAEFAPINSASLAKSVDVDYAGMAEKDAYGTAMRGEYDLGDMKLLSITSGRQENYLMDNDIDFLPMDLVRLKLDKEVGLLSQELRLVSDDKASPLQWLAGAYAFYEKDDRAYATRMNLENMGMTGMGTQTIRQDSTTDALGSALFFQTSYTLWERLELTTGLRYDRIAKDFSYSQKDGDMLGYASMDGDENKTFDAWLPKAAISYKVTDDIRPYVSVSRGFRSGGFNDNEEIGEAYDAEYTWNYEVGVKTEWLDKRLQVNLALFHIDWTDRQVEVLSSGGSSYHIENAGESSSDGVEIEAIARPVQGLELTGSYGYTRAEYDEYSPSASEDYSGKNVIDSPEYTASLGATYRFLDGWFAGATYRRVGKVYFDAANTESQGEYQTVNVRFGYEQEGWDVYLWGRNIFDEEYVTRAAESAAGAGWFGRSGEPQAFGVSASLYF